MTLDLRARLLVLAGIPLAGLLWISVWNTLEKASVVRELAPLEELVVASTQFGAIVHELQKERGMSAGFLGSKGAKFAAELQAQRAESDKRLKDFEQIAGRLDATVHRDILSPSLKEALAFIADLGAKRSAISAQSLTPSQSGTYYTKFIASLLAVPDKTPRLSSVPVVSERAAAYAALLQAKERSGLERANLSSAFAAGSFTPEMEVRFLSNSAAQDAWFATFRNWASKEQLAFFDGKVAGPAVEEVARLRQVAMDGLRAPALGVDSIHWFKVTTERINLLKEVENSLASGLQSVMAGIRSQSLLLTWFYGVGTVLATIIVLLVTRWVGGRILRQLGGEPETAVDIAHAIAGGQLDKPIALRSGDQLSLLASMKRMQEQLAHRMQMERMAAGEIQRVKSALDKASTNMELSPFDGRQS